MKAMILAAGRGERMRPLTNTIPKALLQVAGKALIVHHIEKLARIGIREIVINIAYLGETIREALGDGSSWGVSIQYSPETSPLETGGALLHALPLLGEDPFLLINGDVWTDIDFSLLSKQAMKDYLGCLVLVNNPEHNQHGDFSLGPTSDAKPYARLEKKASSQKTYTFGGVALINPAIVRDYPHKTAVFPLREVFSYFIERQQLSGMYYSGQWSDIGTPERLSALNRHLT